MLNFQPITLGIKELVESYTFKYGEGSCRHSFVSSYTLKHKYGDMFCEHEGFLYTLRSKLCTENERAYFFPFGSRDDESALRRSLQNILDDAHSHNCRAKFQTATESAKDIITSLFPGKFTVYFNRDYSEYVCNIEALYILKGHGRAVKRKGLHKFLRVYEGRCETLPIAEKHIDMIRDFQNNWLDERLSIIEDHAHKMQLEGDSECIHYALDDFFTLGM